jgi:hypothetical protein
MDDLIKHNQSVIFFNRCEFPIVFFFLSKDDFISFLLFTYKSKFHFIFINNDVLPAEA